MRKGQFFIVTAVVIVFVIVSGAFLFNAIPTGKSNNPCFFLFQNLREASVRTINLSLTQNESGSTIDSNLQEFSSEVDEICRANSKKCNFSYSMYESESTVDNVSIRLTVKCEETYLHDEFTYFP